MFSKILGHLEELLPWSDPCNGGTFFDGAGNYGKPVSYEYEKTRDPWELECPNCGKVFKGDPEYYHTCFRCKTEF